MAESGETYVVELHAGVGDPPFVPLYPNKVLDPMSIGRRGMWRVDASGVLDVHAYMYFDGRSLFLQSADEERPILAHGRAVGRSWTSVNAPCTITFGKVRLEFRSTYEGHPDAEDIDTQRAPNPPVRKSERPARPFARGAFASRSDDEDATRLQVEAGSRVGAARPAAGNPSAQPAMNMRPMQPPPIQEQRRPSAQPPPLQEQRRPSAQPPPLQEQRRPSAQPPPMQEPRRPPPNNPLINEPPRFGGAAFTPRTPQLEDLYDSPPLAAPPPNFGPPPMLNIPPAVPLPALQRTEARGWEKVSGPKKILILMSPFMLLAIYLLVRSVMPAVTGPKAVPNVPDAAPSNPYMLTTTPPASAITPPTYSVTPPTFSVTALPSASRDDHPPPPPPPTASAAPPKTLERTAVDLVSLGQYEKAALIYDQLAVANPNNFAYREAARILRQKLDGG